MIRACEPLNGRREDTLPSCSPLWFSLFTGTYGVRLVLDTFPAQLLLGIPSVPYELTLAALTCLVPKVARLWCGRTLPVDALNADHGVARITSAMRSTVGPRKLSFRFVSTMIVSRLSG